jgi:acyl-CoA dehydrogenase
LLLNPHRLSAGIATNRSAEVMAKTVEFFENRGKVALKRDEHERVWPTDSWTSCVVGGFSRHC